MNSRERDEKSSRKVLEYHKNDRKKKKEKEIEKDRKREIRDQKR